MVFFAKPETETVQLRQEVKPFRKELYFNLPVVGPDGAVLVAERDMELGIAATFVHSMDAAHLMLTMTAATEQGIESFAVVHDCFGTVAADAPKLWRILREEFIRMYQVDVLAELRRHNAEWLEIPELPAKGTLDIRGVLNSEFFFS
jgi:DNA-directed RNA polymerase